MGVVYNVSPPPLDSLLLFYDSKNVKSCNATHLTNLLQPSSYIFANTVLDSGKYLNLTNYEATPVTSLNVNNYDVFSIVLSFITGVSVSGTLFDIASSSSYYSASTITVEQTPALTSSSGLSSAAATATAYSPTTIVVEQTPAGTSSSGLSSAAAAATVYSPTTIQAQSDQTSTTTTSNKIVDMAFHPLNDISISVDNSGRTIFTKVKTGDNEKMGSNYLSNDQNVAIVTFKKGNGVNNIKVWINSELSLTTAISSDIQNFSSEEIQLFGRKTKADWFNGKFRAIQIYNRELSQEEINVLGRNLI